MCSINSNNLECLLIYRGFLTEVANDQALSEKITENIKIIKKGIRSNKNFYDEERLKYGENSETGVIVVSADEHSIGIVQHCSSKVRTIFGYFMTEMIGQNISRIMPKAIGNTHDETLKNFIASNDFKKCGVEMFAPAIDKEEFLVPCSMMMKMLPNLE